MARMYTGFATIDRKLYSPETDLYYKPKAKYLFVTLIMLANWKETKAVFKGLSKVIERGQLLTGRTELATHTGLTPQEVRSALKFLEKTERITSQTTSRGTLITIRKYNHYQDTKNNRNQPTNKPITNKEPTDNQPITNKEPTDNHLLTSKQENKKTSKQLNHPSIDLTEYDQYFTTEFFAEMKTNNLMLSKKDLIWAEAREIGGRVFYISVLNFLYDLRNGALESKSIKSNVAWLKHSISNSGNYFSEGYAQNQKRRIEKEAEYNDEFQDITPSIATTTPEPTIKPP